MHVFTSIQQPFHSIFHAANTTIKTWREKKKQEQQYKINNTVLKTTDENERKKEKKNQMKE